MQIDNSLISRFPHAYNLIRVVGRRHYWKEQFANNRFKLEGLK